MKKITITLISLILGFSLMAQDLPYINIDNVSNADRDNEFVCLPGSSFSQVFSTYDQGFYADDGHTYSRAADDYTATSSFTSIRFWGENFCGGSINSSETFVIKFYERNLGNPSIPGTEVYSFTVSVIPVDLGITGIFGCSTPIYQVDADFGSAVTLLDGWVSITRQDPGDGYDFAVLSGDNGTGNEASYDLGTQTWLPDIGNLMFCLGGTESVPVSNWAIYLSIFLMLVFSAFYFRRRLA